MKLVLVKCGRLTALEMTLSQLTSGSGLILELSFHLLNFVIRLFFFYGPQDAMAVKAIRNIQLVSRKGAEANQEFHILLNGLLLDALVNLYRRPNGKRHCFISVH